MFKIVRKAIALFECFLFKVKIFYLVQLSQGKYRIHSSFRAGKNFSIKSDLSDITLKLANNIVFRDQAHIVLGHSGKVFIESNCFFNNGCSINCFGNIEIGNNNQFGEHVFLYDHNHQFGNKDQLISEQGYSIGKITIGNNCWIGSNVVILKNVEIGDHVVIGAGCVIHKSVPANTVVVNQQNLLQKPI